MVSHPQHLVFTVSRWDEILRAYDIFGMLPKWRS
jgi:hypothetical protein